MSRFVVVFSADYNFNRYCETIRLKDGLRASSLIGGAVEAVARRMFDTLPYKVLGLGYRDDAEYPETGLLTVDYLVDGVLVVNVKGRISPCAVHVSPLGKEG